jgi:hopanoid biosynthesis associated RND transporter like protein HpnN
MTIQRLLAALVDRCQRNPWLIALTGAVLVAMGLLIAAHRLGVSTDTNLMFAESLPWRQRQIAFNRDFPQFTNLLVAVIDARIPEEADATANALRDAMAPDHQNFLEVRRPDASPFFSQEGLLLLDQKQLRSTLDSVVAAQPFLGQLADDMSARGLFGALGLLGTGIQEGQGEDIGPFLPAIEGFHQTMAKAIAGSPEPLSWAKLLGGDLADLGGKYKFVLFRINPQFGALEPGGAATKAIREAAAKLEFVKSGEAHMRITGPVALADDEFATVAQGALAGMLGSLALITLWLYLALRTWRLIVPVLLTLGIGLVGTLLFAAVAVGTLNLVSVGFGILFVGIAVDFAIQFSVRYREIQLKLRTVEAALIETGRRAGTQILVAAAATAAGFLAFVPTDFQGVAELGLIAGMGMLIAFICTLIFMPAFITLFHPPGEKAEVGFLWAAPLDPLMHKRRWPIVIFFGIVAVVALILSQRLTFDSDPLHTKDPTTEAVRTLYDLLDSPVTNPFTIDILTPNVADAAAESEKLSKLPLVAGTISIESFMPKDQDVKLALIDDVNTLLGPTLDVPAASAPVTTADIRAAAMEALTHIQPALPKLPAGHPLIGIAEDLRKISTAPDALVMNVNQALTRFLPQQIDELRTLLSAKPITLQTIPQDISRDWLLPDGQARVQVLPRPETRDSAGLRKFVDQVLAVSPTAGGSAVLIEDTSDTIIGAFRSAAITAVAAIALILFVTLRRPLDVALVLAPLILSALMTVLVAVSIPIPLNFANIIALPLLLGVGVSFNIYFVMNWRAGQIWVLSSATARAILFSALTTGTAFGSLAMSHHPGTASMGLLLLISLGCTLIASLAFIPALLAIMPRQAKAGAEIANPTTAYSHVD